MTNINDLTQKLDDLLKEISVDPSPPETLEKPVSWTWECDNQGYYTACSAEVKAILDIYPDEFLGQPISSFQLSPQSTRKLEVILGTMSNESQVKVQFRHRAGHIIPVQMMIVLSEKEGTNERVLHGTNKIITGRG